MKIAILLLSGGVVDRGAEVGVHLLAKELIHLGDEVRLYQAGPSELPWVTTINLPLAVTSQKPRSLLGKVLERLNLDRRGLATLLFSLKVMPYLIRSGIDIIHPVDGFWEVVMSKAMSLLKGSRVVVTGRAGIGWTDAQNLRLKPDLFIALTPMAEKWSQQLNPSVKTATIPEPIDLSRFHPGVKPVQTPLKKPIIMAISALTPYKRLDILIQAVSLLPSASLLILGRGEEREALKKLAEKYLPDRLMITSVNQSQVPAYLAAADVFVHAADQQEAFGRSIVEAQAMGLPVVVNDDPLRHWIAGKSAFYAHACDPRDLAKKIEAALSPAKKGIPTSNPRRFEAITVARHFHQECKKLLGKDRGASENSPVQ